MFRKLHCLRTPAMAVAFVLLILTVPSAHGEEEALTTPEGNLLKVIVREPSARFREADAASPNEPVDTFEWFYCFPAKAGATDKLLNGFYRVGHATTARRTVGFIPADKCVEWPHAQVVGFVPPGQRERVTFFASMDDAIASFKGDKAADERAISREPARKVSSLFPLLEIKQFDHEGSKVDVYKVAYLTRRASKVEPLITQTSGEAAQKNVKKPATREELQQDFKLQICFVVDATASMTPWIEAMVQVIDQVTQRLGESPDLKGRVEFGLVLYRDSMATPELQQQMEFVTKKVCDLTSNHEAFRKSLAEVKVAVIGSEDAAEDVLAGLNVALHEMSWKPAASKHIALILDAPAHLETDGYKNSTKQTIPGIVTLAQPTGADATWNRLQIHALRVVSDEAETARDHVDQITKGRDYPGLHHAYEGDADATKFVQDLISHLEKLAKTTQNVVQGNFTQVEEEAKQSPAASGLGPVLDMIRATEGTSDAAAFREGWAVVLDRQGNRALEPHVLVDQGQLKLFHSALNHCVVSLETAGDPGSRNVQKVVQQLQIIATGINLKEDVHPDMKLGDILSKVLGIPVRNPIFEMTPKRLSAMTARDFQSWVDSVRACQAIAKSHLDNGPIWFSLNQKGGQPHEKLAFIKVSDLP